MVRIKDPARHPVKLGPTLRWWRDSDIAHQTPKNVMPNIPGAYIRWKKIRNRPYAYLVKTYYIDGKRKQKTLRYYGTKAPRRK